MYTIAVHNGSTAHRSHNRRDYNTVSKEPHIRLDGEHENWVDIAPRDAYENLFGAAVKEYNDRQRRSDRKITDYYRQICRDKKKHPVYECIVGVYNDKNSQQLDELTNKAILQLYVQEWKTRNPNLVMIGAYYHNDEQGKQPHLHIDYVPVAHGYKRGMRTQTAIDKALREQGYDKTGRATPQMMWQAAERDALEDICRMYAGIDISHPQAGHGATHLHTDAYKAQQELYAAQEQLSETQAQLDNLPDPTEERERLQKLQKEIDGTKSRLNELKRSMGTLDTLRREYNSVMRSISNVWDEMKDAQVRTNGNIPAIQEERIRRGLSQETLYTVSQQDAETITAVFRRLTPDQMYSLSYAIGRIPDLSRKVEDIMKIGRQTKDIVSSMTWSIDRIKDLEQMLSERCSTIEDLQDYIRDKDLVDDYTAWQEEQEFLHSLEEAYDVPSPEIDEDEPEKPVIPEPEIPKRIDYYDDIER